MRLHDFALRSMVGRGGDTRLGVPVLTPAREEQREGREDLGVRPRAQRPPAIPQHRNAARIPGYAQPLERGRRRSSGVLESSARTDASYGVLTRLPKRSAEARRWEAGTLLRIRCPARSSTGSSRTRRTTAASAHFTSTGLQIGSIERSASGSRR